MKKDGPRIACVGAGCSGAGQMILLEKLAPGCCVAFCDLSRELFDAIVSGYLGEGDSAVAGDFKGNQDDLRPDFSDMPFYTDVDEMLTHEDVDTVIIATYCKSHAEMVEKCVKYNVNILLEKPIAISAVDVEKVWSLLKNYPKVTTVNFTMRGAPVTRAAQRHVRNGAIGKMVSVQYVNNVHYGDTYFRKWMRTQDNIGSLFLQKAVHDFDIINSIVGLKPKSVAAFGSRLIYGGARPNDLTCDTCAEKMTCPMSVHRLNVHAGRPMGPKHQRLCVYAREIDVDDNQVVIIQYEGGVTASYSQTFNAPRSSGRRGGCFIGTEGIMNLEYYGEFIENSNNEISVGESRIEITQFAATAGTAIREAYDWGGEGHFGGNNPGMWAKLDLLNGVPTDVANTIEEGYISTRMCLAAQQSIETGTVVPLDLR